MNWIYILIKVAWTSSRRCETADQLISTRTHHDRCYSVKNIGNDPTDGKSMYQKAVGNNIDFEIDSKVF